MRCLSVVLPLLPAWGVFALLSAGPPGVPFGPFGLWHGAQPMETSVPFTASQNFTSPETVIPMIANARAAKQTLILALTGGAEPSTAPTARSISRSGSGGSTSTTPARSATRSPPAWPTGPCSATR